MEDIVAQSIQIMNQDLVRLDHFDGHNFTRWQEKVLFFHTSLKWAYALSDDLEPIPEPNDGEKEEVKEKRLKRKDDEYMCRGHILNSLSNSVYSAHLSISTAKELWTTLDNKYLSEEASNQKFLIGNYIDFKITKDKPVVNQGHELQLIASDLKTTGITFVEDFQVGVVIEKLPSSCNSYKKKLKHEEKSHTLESLLRHLRIEEESRNHEKKDESIENYHSKANIVESQFKNKLKPKNDNTFKKENCHFCDKPSHWMRDCRLCKKNLKNEANMAEDEPMIATVCKANLVGTDNGWCS